MRTFIFGCRDRPVGWRGWPGLGCTQWIIVERDSPPAMREDRDGHERMGRRCFTCAGREMPRALGGVLGGQGLGGRPSLIPHQNHC